MKAIIAQHRLRSLAAFAIGAALILVVATLILSNTMVDASTAHAHDGVTDALADVRAATARYNDLEQATASKYALFLDKDQIACIANPGVGAMGVHYVNGGLLDAVAKSGKFDPLTPQALVYEPGDQGQMRLVAVEYIVIKQAWDATHSAPPSLFGQEFMMTPDGNRFGIPAFYSLHAWIWKDNPSGVFAMWNPQVSCDADRGRVPLA